MSTEKIMEQAQVFASAWSVVGGPFDDGDAMEVAAQEKAELKRMVGVLAAERDALAAELAEMKRMTGVALMCNHVARMERAESKLAELEGHPPIAYANGDELDNMLDDRVCVVLGSEDGLHRTPVFRRPVPVEPVNARLLDVAVWPAGYCRDPNGKMSIPAGKEEDFNFGYDVGFQEAWEIMNSAISAEGKSPTSQQEHLLQDMHDAGREIDRVMAEPAPRVVRLTAPDIVDALRGNGLYEDSRAFQRLFPILEADARAIESAVLRKNGIEVAE